MKWKNEARNIIDSSQVEGIVKEINLSRDTIYYMLYHFYRGGLLLQPGHSSLFFRDQVWLDYIKTKADNVYDIYSCRGLSDNILISIQYYSYIYGRHEKILILMNTK